MQLDTSNATPYTAERAKVILSEMRFGNIKKAMTPGEVAYTNQVWNTLPGSFSFFDAVCHICNVGNLETARLSNQFAQRG